MLNMNKKTKNTPKKKSNSNTKTKTEVVKPKEKNTKSLQTKTFPVLIIRDGVLFPQTESIYTFSRKSSLQAIDTSIKQFSKKAVFVMQKNAKTKNPKVKDLYTIGTLVSIEKVLKTPNQLNGLMQGLQRVKITKFIPTKQHLVAEIQKLKDHTSKPNEIQPLVNQLNKSFQEAINLGKPVEFLNFMKLMGGVNAGELTDQIASTLILKNKEKQKILETTDVNKRIELVLQHLSKEIEEFKIEKDISSRTQKKYSKHMREHFLRQRLDAIKKELGEDEDDDDISELRKKLKEKKPPKEVKQKIEKEIKRLEMMSMYNPEASYVRTWIETVLELPWKKYSKGRISITRAEKELEKDHYALEDVKDRVLEYLAVLQLKKKNKKQKDQTMPTILCFVGPPGVGKTSIARSIAEALKREFVRISLGGIRDEAEIRGHRRTYVGAMPGRIIKGMQDAGTKNPVFVLDEIDKVGKDYKGDPSAALLEALDPEQNSEFSDHYLDMPFDLSQVLFIGTANTLETIPPALKDRLEIIRFSGYTHYEKLQIAKRHLLEKVMKKNALRKPQFKPDDSALQTLIENYTKEAGVRSLERQIGKLTRKIAKKIAEKKRIPKHITAKTVINLLGPKEYEFDIQEEKDEIGLATGLAWTSSGGDTLFIEVALTPGKGKIRLTGKLGDVMKESAQAAYTYVQAHAQELGIDEDRFAKTDIHIHVPEGAVPKDGPSAGITITTAITSAFTEKPVKRNVAMTGEVTLRGRVLEIGGLKEKVIAAHRLGIKTIVAPQRNKKHLEKIPEKIQNDIMFHFVERVEEVLNIAIQK